MKKLFLFLVLVLFLFSCKKEYKCHCNTIDPQKGFINDVDYTFKERKKTEAFNKCVNKFNESGLATGGISCEIK
jgi:hypothetical protein